MKKVIRLTESDLVRIVRRVLNEQVSVPPILSIPSLQINFSKGPEEQTILLTDRKNPKTQALSYKISAEYAGMDIGGDFKKFVRNADGSLYSEVKIGWAVRQLIPDKFLTEKDKYLKLTIPAENIQQAIDQLKKTNGAKAQIRVPSGVAGDVIVSLQRV